MRYGIVTLAIVCLVVLGAVTIFGRGRNSGTSQNANSVKLAEYATNDRAAVTWTMEGRLLGDDQRKAVRITVTKDSRKIELLDGYAERVEKSQEFSNSHQAFESFTRALDLINYGASRKVNVSDERGVCPNGRRYIYEAAEGSKEIVRTWSSSCRADDGTFGGGRNAATRIAQLFQMQITDYNKFVTGVKF